MTGQTRRGPGCEVDDPYVASQGPTSFDLFERYTNGAALDGHRTSEYYKAYRQPFWPVCEPRTFLTSSYSGNLGYTYAVALGAKVARPDRPVVCEAGDGGFLYNAEELATAVRHKINMVAVVFNDQAYGNVARDLDEGWGAGMGADLHNPNFMKLAEAVGVHGMRAKEPTAVGALVREAIQMDCPVLIEAAVGRMPCPVFFAPQRMPMKYQR